jgi:hypothetical protein
VHSHNIFAGLCVISFLLSSLCFFICSRSSLSFNSLFFHFVLSVFVFCFFFVFILFPLLRLPSYSSILFFIPFLVLSISFFHSLYFSTLKSIFMFSFLFLFRISFDIIFLLFTSPPLFFFLRSILFVSSLSLSLSLSLHRTSFC